MSHHARIEEVSDSDPDDMDPSDFDPRQSIISPANIPSSSSTSAAPPRPAASAPPAAAPQPAPSPRRDIPRHFQCLYPIYFDKGRSRAEGRKVGKKLAVANPLARDILDACQTLGLQVAFEVEKLHPKDWANPGRVRVLLKDESGRSVSPAVKNKHHLYIKVAEYLQSHPTTEDSPFRLLIRGMPTPEKPVPAPPAPRGWKLGSILPLHSPALTGGGVSDNPFKEAMAEMQAQQGIAADTPGSSGTEGKKKKDKKKSKA